MPTLQISGALREELLGIARAAFPLECCGLIEGQETREGWRATALHPARNLAADPSRFFEIDPQAQFTLLRELRGTDRRIIGCFHSHPNGRSAPSERDREMAVESGFVWLIVHGREGATDLSAFVFTAPKGEFDSLSLAF